MSETALERWFRRRAEHEGRIVVLEEALLGDRLWRYSWYRLRWFFLRYVVESAAHAVTVFLLFRGLAWDNFLLVVVATTLTALILDFWWGALEALRARVRDLHRSGSPHRIPRVIGGWLAFSLALSVGALALGIAWAAWLVADGSFGPADGVIAALALRLALDLPTRCYHSGVFALRRVYRPLTASLAPELLSLAMVLALWPFVGVWAVVASTLSTTLVTTGLTLLYVRRVYHFLGFAPLREATGAAIRSSLRGTKRESLLGGFSHAVMALDALAVLALLYRAETDSNALFVLFLTMPTIRAGADWANILYFDLKRLELRLFTNLRRRFERHTLELAWLLGLAFCAAALGITAAFDPESVSGLAVPLIGFFVARSLLARAQVQAFAEGAYTAVLTTGALCLVGLGAIGPFASGEAQRLGAVALVAAFCAVALSRISQAARAQGEPGTALLTLEWLRRLGHVRATVRIGSARVVASTGGAERLDARSREDRNRWRLSQLAEHTARVLGKAGAAAWIGPDRVTWFEPADGRPRVTADLLQRASGGLIGDVRAADYPNGEEALLGAGRDGIVGYASGHLLQAILPVDVDAARQTFVQLIPGGVVFDPDQSVPPELARLSGSELRAILVDALAFARDLRVGRRRSTYDVTALCSGGELRLVFVADLGASRRARTRWRHLVTTLNVRGAIAGVSAATHPARVGRLAFLRT